SLDSIVGCPQQDDAQAQPADFLLVLKVAIHGDERGEPRLGGARQWFATLETGPTEFCHRAHLVPAQLRSELARDRFIDEDAHPLEEHRVPIRVPRWLVRAKRKRSE